MTSSNQLDSGAISILDVGEWDCLESATHYEVLSGTVDLFLSPNTGNDKGKHYPICRFSSGNLILGLKGAVPGSNWRLLASGTPETQLKAIKWHNLIESVNEEDPNHYYAALQSWQQRLMHYIAQNGLEDELPSTPINCAPLKESINEFYQAIHPLLIKGSRALDLRTLHHTKQLKRLEKHKLRKSYQEMLGVLSDVSTVHKMSAKDTLTPCVRHLADYFEMSMPEQIALGSLDDLSLATGIQFREIALSGDWWLTAASPILLKKEQGEHFCIALPGLAGGYELFDPAAQSRVKLTAAHAKQFIPVAWQAYRPLPQKKLSLKELVPFSFWGAKLDVVRLVIVGSLAAILSLATPWFTAFIFDFVVPNGEVGQLIEILLGLTVAALAASLFELVRAITIIRLSGKINLNLEVGIWDRLIRLPVSFFKHYTTGELTVRAMAASGMRHVMAGVVITSLLSGIFSLFSFALLFYYDVKLAVIASVGTLILCGFTIAVSLRQYAFYKLMQDKVAKLSGVVVQLLSGIAKIQGNGKEKLAFSQWADKNTEIKNDAYQANWLHATLSTFNAIWLPLLSVLIFAYIANKKDPISLGAFLAFNAALGQFTAGMLGLTSVVSSIIQSIPMLNQMTPIIENTPEIHSDRIDPGILTGKIEADNLFFRYSNDGANVLNGVSFSAEAGQYIAVTGPSGSGKSTLLRLLLGFEAPLQGNIYFDDHDIQQLNPQKVRQQCGVVLQNSQLMPGSLYENIVGSAPLTIEDAMQAAERAGLLEDIAAMPMGMHTMVSERGGTLSGGQRQRVLIARALARKPKIIFFDEATSALDNRTQTIVIQSLETLKVTRVVIAHRLSTIQKADRILVMDKGEVVQDGSYQALIRQQGLFKSMAERQLAE